MTKTSKGKLTTILIRWQMRIVATNKINKLLERSQKMNTQSATSTMTSRGTIVTLLISLGTTGIDKVFHRNSYTNVLKKTTANLN